MLGLFLSALECDDVKKNENVCVCVILLLFVYESCKL